MRLMRARTETAPDWRREPPPSVPSPTDFPPGRSSRQRATMPHCDSSILHPPGICCACDEFPDWQKLRELWRVNFTGQHDPAKAPCPSEHSRTAKVRDRWAGNRAVSPEPPEPLSAEEVALLAKVTGMTRAEAARTPPVTARWILGLEAL